MLRKNLNLLLLLDTVKFVEQTSWLWFMNMMNNLFIALHEKEDLKGLFLYFFKTTDTMCACVWVCVVCQQIEVNFKTWDLHCPWPFHFLVLFYKMDYILIKVKIILITCSSSSLSATLIQIPYTNTNKLLSFFNKKMAVRDFPVYFAVLYVF